MGIDKAMIEIGGHSMISRVVRALTLAELEPIRIAVLTLKISRNMVVK